jgi:hypothetical protein
VWIRRSPFPNGSGPTTARPSAPPAVRDPRRDPVGTAWRRAPALCPHVRPPRTPSASPPSGRRVGRTSWLGGEPAPARRGSSVRPGGARSDPPARVAGCGTRPGRGPTGPRQRRSCRSTRRRIHPSRSIGARGSGHPVRRARRSTGRSRVPAGRAGPRPSHSRSAGSGSDPVIATDVRPRSRAMHAMPRSGRSRRCPSCAPEVRSRRPRTPLRAIRAAREARSRAFRRCPDSASPARQSSSASPAFVSATAMACLADPTSGMERSAEPVLQVVRGLGAAWCVERSPRR